MPSLWGERFIMIANVLFRLALAVSFIGIAPSVIAQEAGKSEKPGSVSLDAAPSDGAAPDPLAPPEAKGPPPMAPGAPDTKPSDTKPSETAQAPLPEPDPVATQILARLANAAQKSDAREDVAGMTAFYTDNKGHPIWTSKEGFNPQALKVIREIKSADDWGLDAAAFKLPANPGREATPEALADADIRLSLAVLKYARHARGGRTDPPSISPIIDRRPRIYNPKSVLEAISSN